MLTPTDYPVASHPTEEARRPRRRAAGSRAGSGITIGWRGRSRRLRLDHLRALEAESLHIIREVVAEFARPVMLYSIGKDSSVMLRLAQKAFYPAPIPFPLLHVDTTYKFREMITFRDRYARQVGARLIVHTNKEAIADGTQPFAVGTQRCCGLLKTKGCSTRSRRAASTRRLAAHGATRNARAPRNASSRCAIRRANGIRSGSGPSSGTCSTAASGRARASASSRSRTGPSSTSGTTSTSSRFPVVPLYFAQEREVVVRGNSLMLREQDFVPLLPGERAERVMCRMRSLGCSPCTGAVRSTADTVPKIIQELITVRQSERQLRVIDHDQDGSMEMKKREGYF